MKARYRRIRYHPMNNRHVWRTSIHQLLIHCFLPYEEEMKRLGLSSLSGYKYEGRDKDKRRLVRAIHDVDCG